MTFYSHYDAVDDVLVEFVDEMTDELLANQGGYEYFNLSSLLDQVTELMNRELEFFRLVVKGGEFDFCRRQFRQAFKRVFNEELGRQKNCDEVLLKVGSDVIASGITYAYFDWLSGEFDDLTQTELTEYFERILGKLVAATALDGA